MVRCPHFRGWVHNCGIWKCPFIRRILNSEVFLSLSFYSGAAKTLHTDKPWRMGKNSTRNLSQHTLKHFLLWCVPILHPKCLHHIRPGLSSLFVALPWLRSVCTSICVCLCGVYCVCVHWPANPSLPSQVFHVPLEERRYQFEEVSFGGETRQSEIVREIQEKTGCDIEMTQVSLSWNCHCIDTVCTDTVYHRESAIQLLWLTPYFLLSSQLPHAMEYLLFSHVINPLLPGTHQYNT